MAAGPLTDPEMSTSDVNFQTQVASVLDALVKQATMELTKLFESRYQASARAIASSEERIQRIETFGPLNGSQKAHKKDLRSIGVQVDEQISPTGLLDEKCSSSKGGDCLNERTEEEPPPDNPAPQDNEHVVPQSSVLKEKDVKMVEESPPKPPKPPKSPKTKPSESHATDHGSPEKKHKSSHKSPPKQKPLQVQPEEKSPVKAKSKVKYVCPLVLKTAPAPEPECPEESADGEPQQASVSTAEGTAYSPSSSDGATGPLQTSLWDRISNVNQGGTQLHLKLKLKSDKKLTQACSVNLVNLRCVTDHGLLQSAEALARPGAKSKRGLPPPKDLRTHQGAHTGHRLCCFTQCSDEVWRLQSVVDHSREGYACTICGKRFKRRKILRRHERFHTGEKPYSCSHCSKSFALRKSLRRHERFHTGERPHTCPQCGKSFRLRDNLKAHLRFHTGEKPFVCSLCGKCFRISRNLEKHRQSECIALVPSFRKIAGL